MQQTHKMPQKQAEKVAEGVRGWPALIQYSGELEMPTCRIQPIRELPIYPDGLLCQLDLVRCQKIVRSEKSMKTH